MRVEVVEENRRASAIQFAPTAFPVAFQIVFRVHCPDVVLTPKSHEVCEETKIALRQTADLELDHFRHIECERSMLWAKVAHDFRLSGLTLLRLHIVGPAHETKKKVPPSCTSQSWSEKGVRKRCKTFRSFSSNFHWTRRGSCPGSCCCRSRNETRSQSSFA